MHVRVVSNLELWQQSRWYFLDTDQRMKPRKGVLRLFKKKKKKKNDNMWVASYFS